MCRRVQPDVILALIAMLSLGVAACGASDDDVEQGTDGTAVEESVDVPTGVAAELTEAPAARLLADDLALAPGECTSLIWETSGALRVYIDGEAVEDVGQREVCPAVTTMYSLRVLYEGDTEEEHHVTIEVLVPTDVPTDVPLPTAIAPPTAVRPTTVPATAAPTAVPTSAVSISFTPANGAFEIPKEDRCTSVSWQTTGVTAVQLERNADGRRDVQPTGTEEACFGEKEVKYTLWFKRPDGAEDKREIVIKREN